MKRYLIKDGHVIDPSNDVDGIIDIVVANGKIEKIQKGLNDKVDEIIDAKNKIVAPGLIDMHVHLREPGREDEETVLTGTRSAIRGGFTSVLCMPNTEPALDNPKTIKALNGVINRNGVSNVLIAGAITKGRAGKKLTALKEMKREGIVAISDDGSSIDEKDVMFEALKAAKKESLLLVAHCEDAKISRDGVINYGFISTKMGLRGMPREAEYTRAKRDLELTKKASSKIHIAHVSCKESVDLIRKAKKEGIAVTCETAPHYFALTEDCCATYDTNTKMNPPLRAKEDVEAIKRALSDGTIDAIATDHAPHTDSEKDVEFDFAPFGIIGLETALSLAVMELVETKILSWPELILKMSANPSRLLKLGRGSLKKGSVADIVIIDPDKEYI
ncbi:MAG: dihydroorotase, partial [Candidatus Omnitrophica bacterium]|nr:dihydroorotase [Candidatus Omnitrophota bacterium]